MIRPDNIRVIGFDADDTLWENESFFREAESRFAEILAGAGVEGDVVGALYRTEIANLPIYGYGIKAFILSLMECALELTQGRADADTIQGILEIGKEMLQRPVRLLEGVPEVLGQLSSRYRLIVATKGDLLDQERKMRLSGISSFFHHIEVMSDKKEQNYIQLLSHLDIDPCAFLMIGNSMKSDILPPLNLGAQAIHVPFHTTWAHEEVDTDPVNAGFVRVQKIEEVPALLVNH